MRWWHKILLSGLTLLLLLVAAGYWYWQQTLATLELHNLRFDIKTVNLHQLQLNNISFDLKSADMQVQLDDVEISWHFPTLFTPQLRHVSLNGGRIHIQQWPGADTDQTAATPIALPQNWQLPTTLPEAIKLKQLHLSLPCGQRHCHYLIDSQIVVQQQRLSFDLTTFDAGSADIARLAISGQYQTSQGLPVFNAKVNLDNSTTMTLQQTLTLQHSLHTAGKISLDIAPPSPWLIQQLTQWQIDIPENALAQFTSPVSLNSSWQFDLPAQLDMASISAQASGNWMLDLNLPVPLSVPGIGQLQGTVKAAVGLTQGELTEYQINSELTLLQPQLPDALLQQGIAIDSVQITLTTNGTGAPQITALPLQIALKSAGESKLDFTAAASLNLTPPFSAALRNASLQLRQKTLIPAQDVTIEQLQLNSRFNAYWLSDSWQVDLLDANGSIRQLTVADSRASEVTLALSASQFAGDSDFTRMRFNTDLNLTSKALLQPELKPLSWHGQAKVKGDLTTFNAEGTLGNSASFGLTYQFSYLPSAAELNWQLDDIFLLAGNPLQATLSAWPALLEFNRGRLGGSGSITLLPQLSAQGSLNLSGVSGIYDRSLFKDLTAPVQLGYQQDQLKLSTTAATVTEIQHGLVVGPLKLSANYTAATNNLSGGALDIQLLQVAAMGGRVEVQPIVLDFTKQQQELVLQLQRIDLTQLLQQHPTTDLTGNGRISGTVPLLISHNGASVKNGFIAAESPGGKLQYRPPAAQSMAAGNQGMKVVLEALDDFHYSVLSSNVSYDTQGKLTLALNLQGRNPALEAGRAVNLNINLEEDIPALLTSLQLSSQISDKIKQRVQQRLQQSGAKRANGVKP
jgi:hypothetical protein